MWMCRVGIGNSLSFMSAAVFSWQVLHQLKRLGIVWQDILPVNIYCKAMGTLLNTAISEIIGRITALEVRAIGCLTRLEMAVLVSNFRFTKKMMLKSHFQSTQMVEEIAHVLHLTHYTVIFFSSVLILFCWRLANFYLLYLYKKVGLYCFSH